MNSEHKTHLKTYKPKSNIDKNFSVNSDYQQKTRRHYSISPGENDKSTTEVPKGRRHIQAPFNKDHIIFESPEEKAKPKPFEKPRPNTKPEFHSKKYAPSRPILKSRNESSISFNYFPETNNTNNRRNVNTRVDPASLPAAGTKTGFYGIR